jgi:BsaWI restriction endonuclease type 2
LEVAATCPAANPSDLWQHIVYRHLLEIGCSDQRWKRVSGFALERAFVSLYQPRLLPHRIRMHIINGSEGNRLLTALGITDTRSTKVDLFIEGQGERGWLVFGAAHVKSSIAERIQDDVPASRAFMERGLLSVALTMDAKSYPPPHGNCINYGELGGRSLGIEKERIKRNYIEVNGQFDGLFSFNLRTPPSPATTRSGKRIYTMSLHEDQPDQLVQLLLAHWTTHRTGISI